MGMSVNLKILQRPQFAALNRSTITSKISQSARSELDRSWRMAIRLSLEEAAERVQVLTGMSKASLFPLAKELWTKRAYLRDNGGQPLPGYYNWTYWNPNDERSIQHGLRLGEDAYIISYENNNGLSPYFEFTIPVYQFARHQEKWAFLETWKSSFYKNLFWRRGRYLGTDATQAYKKVALDIINLWLGARRVD